LSTVRSAAGALVRGAFAAAAVAPLAVLAVLPRKPSRLIVWGPEPVINYKYWSAAMRGAGWQSTTLVSSYASINARADFDVVHDDLVPRWVPTEALRHVWRPYAAMAHVLRNAGVYQMAFSGGPLGTTALRRLEAPLLRWAGVRTVVIPIGGDVLMYTRLEDTLLRDALLHDYPQLALGEDAIVERVNYWTRHADVVLVGFTVEGLPRWDAALGNFLCIDTGEWEQKREYGDGDGVSGRVRVLHAPNHRAVKGTSFLESAVDRLREEGLDVELVLVEGVPNTEIRRLMQEVDVLADQFICAGYGLAAIEAMASGLPVICNLDALADGGRLFRLSSFLEECPVVSATPETLTDTLRTLVRHPELRQSLGAAGRAYAEKYQSYEAAQHLFGAVYAKLLDGADVDLRATFDPQRSEFNRRRPVVVHPLVESRLPADYGGDDVLAEREHA
jgi:hypothetical protein